MASLEPNQQEASDNREALELASLYGEEFAAEVLRDARILAFNKRQRVTRAHVEEAWNNIQQRRAFDWLAEIVLILSGLLLGVAIQEFITKGFLPAPSVIAGIIGVALMVFGLIRKVTPL